MNHDAPVTPAALQAHIAELEQQLKLSDEGVSQLAQRCLELEQQLLTCQTELSRHSAEAENITLTLPQLFYDTGSGFSPRECLVATEDAHNELTHEVSVTFVLPEDARAVRLDPGELACCITDLAISDERSSFQPVNGLVLQEDSLLFLDVDPNLSLHCTTGFGAGMKFAVNYHYYPLGRFLHEQPGKSLLRALNDLKLKNATAAQEADEVLQAAAQTADPAARPLSPPDILPGGVGSCTPVTVPCSASNCPSRSIPIPRAPIFWSTRRGVTRRWKRRCKTSCTASSVW